MEFIYINKLVSLKESKNWNDTGVDEIIITQKEQENGILFPLSYREFLSYSGKWSSVVKLIAPFDSLQEAQKEAQDLLTEYNLGHLIKKRFWVIGTSGDSDSFWYFHLDDGDNPPIYRLSCMYYEDYPDESSFGKVSDSFQDWIERAIENYESDPVNN